MDTLPKGYILGSKTVGQSTRHRDPHYFYHDKIIPKWKKGKVPNPPKFPTLEDVLDHYGRKAENLRK